MILLSLKRIFGGILTAAALVIATNELDVSEGNERECLWDPECEALYQPGSKCLEDGTCSNPYVAGCMNHFYTHQAQSMDAPNNNNNNNTMFLGKRTCNSDDKSTENCEPSAFNYHEIRVHNSDWSSVLFYSWIMQIFLTEFLQVPSTVGLRAESAEASFYAPTMPVSFSSITYAWDGITNANDVGGRCDLTEKDCIHVLPEVWNAQEKIWNDLLSQGVLDQVKGNGELGKISLFIPLHTAEQYPSMVSYHGMKGNREEMASIFKRPTTWGDYCASHSPTNCTEDDGVAIRPPVDEDEAARYFLDGKYTGFFRSTDKNDCSKNPDTCTGHIVRPPCDWVTNIDAQLYWNDVALEEEGPLSEIDTFSTDEHMHDIWRAANATMSHVIMWWWSPDTLVQEFQGTSYQFQPVMFPEPTAECLEARVTEEDLCSPDPVARRGTKLGSCDEDSHPLQTLIASSLRSMTYNIPEVNRSPGYQALLNLKVSQLDMNAMIHKWAVGGRTGYAARVAICDWVIDHEEKLKSFIPRGYPRVFAENTSYDRSPLHVAVAMGALAVLYGLIIAAVVFRCRTLKVFVYAHVPFVFMVIVGMVLVAVGSIFVALEPQDTICILQKWFVTVGYTIGVVPLLVKIAAVNRHVAATERLQKVRIKMRSLELTVVAVVLVAVIFMTIWTMTDPSHRREGRYLEDGDDVEVMTTIACTSGSRWWDLGVLAWNGILILCSTMLAFQSRTVRAEFNDSQSLGKMIYGHFVFGVLRLVCFTLSPNQGLNHEDDGGYTPIDPSTLAAGTSLLLSLDAIIAVTIHILPKLFLARQLSEGTQSDSSGPTSNGMEQCAMGRSGGTGGQNGTLHGSDKNSIGGSFRSFLEGSGRKTVRQSPRKMSLNASAGRIGMDGNICSIPEEHSASSDDGDWGGPRFEGQRHVPPRSQRMTKKTSTNIPVFPEETIIIVSPSLNQYS